MSKHERFILTPITSVIEEMNAATSCIGKGIETYALWDYILQSTFTKMTGFQEQKMKCIDWELATNGYDYRLSFLEDVKEKGTYSTYAAKNKVYNALINEILRYSGKDRIDYITELKKRKSINPRESIQQLLEKNSIIYCKQRDFNEFKKSDKEFKNQFFVVPTDKSSKSAKLFESGLTAHYVEELYRQRNRIAHNTLSYQQNLPDLEMLKGEKALSRNYFFWFAILFLIDEIFMELFRDYSQCLKDNSYFND